MSSLVLWDFEHVTLVSASSVDAKEDPLGTTEPLPAARGGDRLPRWALLPSAAPGGATGAAQPFCSAVCFGFSTRQSGRLPAAAAAAVRRRRRKKKAWVSERTVTAPEVSWLHFHFYQFLVNLCTLIPSAISSMYVHVHCDIYIYFFFLFKRKQPRPVQLSKNLTWAHTKTYLLFPL